MIDDKTNNHTGPPAADSTTSDWVGVAREIGLQLGSTVAERDETGHISHTAFELLRDRGATRALIPAEFGGGGATHAEIGAMLRELGRHDAPTTLTLSMHSHIVATQVWRHRHGMDATGFFTKVMEGSLMISTGASDWVGSSGTARPVEGGYLVAARKTPISGCEVGDVLVTSIRWDDAPDGPQVIHCSIPFGADGVSIEQTWDTLGMRATGSHTVVLDEVFVPEAAVSLVRPADAWPPLWNTVLGSAMPLIMSPYVGIADRAVALATAFVEGREDPHVLQLVGEMITAHTMGADSVKAMLASSDNLSFDNTDEHSSLTLARKNIAADSLIQSVRLAIEVTGGFGYTKSSEIERLYRDVHGCMFHPLPRAKQARFSGRVALGLDPVG
ncbi:MAG: acyl-CoA/acyl-ACP dehydrogenase [Actinomycetia bacterium]|nr:acyl-CoA/acyl-ACP dehydrogenase [Actinomycetes bacterium]